MTQCLQQTCQLFKIKNRDQSEGAEGVREWGEGCPLNGKLEDLRDNRKRNPGWSILSLKESIW